MIDIATFSQLQQDVGEDLAKQLLQVYLTESTQIVNDIADNSKQATICLNAHSLKSSSRSYGALTVGTIAEQIEHKAKTAQFDSELSNLIATLQDQFSLTLRHGNSLISAG